MRIIIGVDDTDNADSISTIDLLENMCDALRDNGLARIGFITCHRLCIHNDIPYTTSNSAACCDAETEKIGEVIEFCRSYISDNCAEGSGVGLCIINLGKLTHRKRLIRFGYAAKSMVLAKRDALDVAQLHGRAIYLSEHGGTGRGVIGALAACGLRLSGNDGMLRAKLKPPRINRIITVGELCRLYALSSAVTPEQTAADGADTVNFCCPTRAVLVNHRPAIYLAKDNSGKADWCVFGLQEMDSFIK